MRPAKPRKGKRLDPWYGAKYDIESVVRTQPLEHVIWSYLERLKQRTFFEEIARSEHGVHKGRPLSQSARIAPNFISQAREYFDAARSSSILTSPDMYYYSFLNLVKAFIALKRPRITSQLLSVKTPHGMSIDAIDYSKRVSPTNQVVKVQRHRNGVFTLFSQALGLTGYHGSFRIVDLCSLCPDLQDNFWETSKRWPPLIRITEFQIRRDDTQRQLWVVLKFDRGGIRDVFNTFRQFFDFFSDYRWISGEDEENEESIYMESINSVRYSRGFKGKIPELRKQLLNRVLHVVQSGTVGFYDIPCMGNVLDEWHFSMVLFAGMCYFSNVARYYPLAYEKLIEGRYGWIFKDFILSSSTRFIHTLLNEFYKREFVILRSYS